MQWWVGYLLKSLNIDKMVLAELFGGLGNQMFQYAFAKKIASDLDTDLYIDIKSFNTQVISSESLPIRNFELNVFELNVNIASNEQRNVFFDNNTLLKKIKLKKSRLLKQQSLIYETKYGYDEKVLRAITNNTYLYGYWQSFRYFYGFESNLIADFNFRVPNNRNIEIEELIKESNSVSIHIRRGDYANNVEANKTHGIIPLKFYIDAIEIIKSSTVNPKWFIFSDDIKWCKENFTFLDNVTYVSEALQTASYYEMYLMTLCKYNIIANSTFSWWGAWLNRFKNKIVIAPTQWFNNKSIHDMDLLLEGWIAI